MFVMVRFRADQDGDVGKVIAHGDAGAGGVPGLDGLENVAVTFNGGPPALDRGV
jgi:hypothetical protein